MKKIIFISSVCGVGKTSTCDYIKSNNLLDNYAIFDADDLLNIHDYNDNILFYEDNVKVAVEKSDNKNIVLGSCINPVEIKKIRMPSNVETYKMILIYCSNEELEKRLKLRDKSRNCSSDEFIKGQIEYQNYMLNHKDLFNMCIDNTDISTKETSKKIIDYINNNK